MKSTKILTILAVILLVIGLASCTKDNNKKPENNSSELSSLLAVEPGSEKEATELHRKLMARETAILSEKSALWEKVFMSANKGSTMIEDGSNYGDFLLRTIEGAKDQFNEDELKFLKAGAEEIRTIEVKLTALENKYPGCGKKPSDDDMSVPAENGKPVEDGEMKKFPAFEGKDLDGKDVKSSELFSGNSVTVVNFWFTTCSPCVGELKDLDNLNKELEKKGGAVIGINSFTLDGKEKEIADAKDILSKKGVSYRNVYFSSTGEAGKFTSNLFSFPTTYVVDRNGNIVGEPIVGAITSSKQMQSLQALIDKAIANDKK